MPRRCRLHARSPEGREKINRGVPQQRHRSPADRAAMCAHRWAFKNASKKDPESYTGRRKPGFCVSLYEDSPEILFFRVARAACGAICASASAGGFAFFLVFHHSDDDRCNNGNQNGTDDDRCNVFPKPCKHSIHLLFLFAYFATFTFFVSFVASE